MTLTTKIIADKVIEITGCDIRIENRNREFVIARYIYAKLCNELIFDSVVNVALEINKNHTTVLYYLKQVSNEHVFKGDIEYNYDLIKSNLFGEKIDISNKYLKEIKEDYKRLNEKFGRLTKKHLDITQDYNLLKKDYQRLLLVNLKLKNKYIIKQK